MKKPIFITFFLAFPLFLQAQVAGNAIKQERFNEANSLYGNAYQQQANYNDPYRVNSVVMGENNLDFDSDTVVAFQTNVLMNVKADSYVAMFGLSQVGETVEDCNALLNKRADGFIDALVKMGITRRDIYVDFVSQVPVFEVEVEKKLFSKSYNEVPKGFELRKNIHVGYKDNDLLEKMLSEAARYEIYDIIKVDYVIDDVEAIYDTLRQHALRLSNKKSDALKRTGVLFNTNLYELVDEKINNYYPIERYSRYTAFSNPSLNALKRNGVQVNLEPKSETIYYAKLPYKGFDKVINPQVIEPVAQFTYQLRVKYVLKKK